MQFAAAMIFIQYCADNLLYMQTRVLPFIPAVTDANPAEAAAAQLQEVVDKMASDDWNFVSLTSMQTAVSATGCASFGNNSGPEMVPLQLVFQK